MPQRPPRLGALTTTGHRRDAQPMGRDEINGYDVFNEETVSAPEPEPDDEQTGEDDQ